MSARIVRLPINPSTYVDRTVVDVSADEVPPFGLFLVAFDNRKKQKNGLQRHTAYGVLYPSSGHVHLDTIAVQVHDFQSLQQMIDYLENYGDCSLQWIQG